MFTKERGISVLCGFMFFLGGLYLFTIMASEINIRSFCIVTVFSIISLFLTATVAQNLGENKNSESKKPNGQLELTLFELQEKLSSLKTENLRLLKATEVGAPQVSNGPSENQASGLMLRQRAFIHDIASPVSIAQGMIELAMKSLEADPKNSKAKLEKALNAISKISQKVQENRDYLIMSAS